MPIAFPFSAIVAQDEMKQALLIAAVDPSVGGVLVFGDRGTGKSTAIRGLAALLPEIEARPGCPCHCDPREICSLCNEIAGESERVAVPVVDLPLGVTEDRIVGALDLERALTRGEKAFEPGLLARANRGFLYIDEVNLLEDHLVDLLLDAAASGENVVEREGLSVRHPARFVLIGSGNPEEGELRPQLLDRFGLSVEITTPQDIPTRVEVVRRRDAFERNPAAFAETWAAQDRLLRAAIASARERLAALDTPRRLLEYSAQFCLALGTDGLRGELSLIRAARALACLEGDDAVSDGSSAESRAVRPAPPPAPRSARRGRLDRPHRTRARRGFRAVTPMTPWMLAEWAARLFAVDPAGTGVCIRARPGPQLDRWLAMLRASMADRPWRKLPPCIADDRLLGGLDLAATLAAGRPVAEQGVLAGADGGAVLVPSAERLSPGLAARIAAVHDSGEIHLERDGLRRDFPARFGLILIDEGLDEDERPPAALLDRLAFRIDLTAVTLADMAGTELPGRLPTHSPAQLAQVTIGEDAIEALCGASASLGIGSARAALLAMRAAKAAAAHSGRGSVSEEDLALAASLVLAWRATALPADEPEAPDDPPDSEPRPDETGDASGSPDEAALDDIVLAAVRAALPPDALARLIAERTGASRQGQAGRTGAVRKAGRRGRRIGTARGDPRGGARLDLVATLRAAAPWQSIRQYTSEPRQPTPHPPASGGSPLPEDFYLSLAIKAREWERAKSGDCREAPDEGGADSSDRVIVHGKIQIRPSDFRTVRFAERRETLTIFAVDASGSLALNRLAEAKGAVELLLADCYIRRDQVALIAFRGRRAELLLPPTRSLVRAKRCLSGLPGGGGTPLASGIDAAAALAQSALRRGQTPLIVMLTDGRANVARSGEPGRPAAHADALASARILRAGRMRSLLIDTSPQPEPRAEATRGGDGRGLPGPAAISMPVSSRGR